MSLNSSSSVYYLYTLVRSDGSIFYVGQTKNPHSRFGYHLRYGKLGVSRQGSYTPLVLELHRMIEQDEIVFMDILSEHGSEAEAVDAEKLLISQIGIDNLTNITAGGRGYYGIPLAESTKQKLRERFAGIPLTSEHKAKIGAANRKNKPASSKAMLEKWSDPVYREEQTARIRAGKERQHGNNSSEEARRHSAQGDMGTAQGESGQRRY